jgi:hypothetical protein
VGLEGNGERILNPDSSVILQENDIMWVVRLKEKLEEFLRGKVVGKKKNYHYCPTKILKGWPFSGHPL